MTATDRAKELAIAAAEAASDKLADDIVAYDVSDVFVITDAFVLASAPNDRQVRAIVDAIEERLQAEHGAKPARREGEQEGRWVLLDYIDIVVHVQHADERTYYSLERLWKDCPILKLPESVHNGRSVGAGPGSAARGGAGAGGGDGAAAANGSTHAISDAVADFDADADADADPDFDADLDVDSDAGTAARTNASVNGKPSAGSASADGVTGGDA